MLSPSLLPPHPPPPSPIPIFDRHCVHPCCLHSTINLFFPFSIEKGTTTTTTTKNNNNNNNNTSIVRFLFFSPPPLLPPLCGRIARRPQRLLDVPCASSIKKPKKKNPKKTRTTTRTTTPHVQFYFFSILPLLPLTCGRIARRPLRINDLPSVLTEKKRKKNNQEQQQQPPYSSLFWCFLLSRSFRCLAAASSTFLIVFSIKKR